MIVWLFTRQRIYAISELTICVAERNTLKAFGRIPL